MRPPRTLDGLAGLRLATPARVGLGRVGQSLPTEALLDFQLAHARAKDAVRAVFDVETTARALGGDCFITRSAAPDRTAYLMNPALGRRLDPKGPPLPKLDPDLALVLADGLSAAAVHAHAPPLVKALRERLTDWRLSPPVLVSLGRVAVGDAVAEALGARAVVILLGERPGLTAADSLSAYLSWSPRAGMRDSERNCVSNIHAGGLSIQAAADTLVWLLREARRLGRSGTALKDRQPAPPPDETQTTLAPPGG